MPPVLPLTRETRLADAPSPESALPCRPLDIVDVREPRAFERGHVAGAVCLPLAELELRVAELPPRSATFWIVGGDTAEARAAVELLSARGFAGARPAPAEMAAGREEVGPARRVLWRAAPWLLECQRFLPARGRALDVATGSGRNATALALAGLDVCGFDLLPDALVRATRLARAAFEARHAAVPGVRLGDASGGTGQVAFLAADAGGGLPFRADVFDAILVFRYLERALPARLVPLLAPGGVLVWETFTVEQVRFGRPTRADFLLAPGELAGLVAAAGLVPLAGREAVHEAGPALASVAARRP